MPAGTLVVVAGWVVSPILKELIGEVKSLVTSKYTSFKHFRKQLDQLISVLEQIKTTVETVQGQRTDVFSDDGMISWVSRLMDAINEVEDILDDFAYDDALLSNLATKHKVRQVAHSAVKAGGRLIGRDKTFSRLKELLDELPRIQQSLRDLVQLPQIHADSRCSSMSRPATGPVLAPDELFVGYKEQYDELMSALLNDNPSVPSSSNGGNRRNAQVVAVIGHGGSGKTAIVQRAWSDERVKNRKHFDLRIWASVPYKFSKTDLLTEIWRSIPGSCHKFAAEMSFGKLQQEVLGLIASKRYLLVLDDVCNDESDEDQRKKTWDDVLAPFRVGRQGSRILMTSRAKICSKTLGASTRIKLDGIDAGDLVLVLKESAFGDAHKDAPLVDDVIASVAQQLKGSPAAAKTFAYKVRNKHRKKDWKELLESGYCSQITSVTSANASSYQHLPHHLRSCLGFCSMFPDKWSFEPETLVKMWIAHGIINVNRSDGRSMEDVGREYIRALQERSFFNATKDGGKATFFVIHEQIHLMLLSVSANYFFRIGDDNRRCSIPPSVRHLSVTGGCMALAQLKNDPVLKKLRTLLVFDGPSSSPSTSGPIDSDVLKQLKAVRVLDLAGTGITELPKDIGKSKHLRYLGLPNALKSIPAAITKLLHLQTLALGKDCKLDHGFPADGMNRLINLRHLDMDMKYIAMISGIGTLEKLQGSVEFCADRGQGHGMEELADINSLRGTLSIKGLHSVANKEEAQKAQLGRKEFIKVLNLEWEPKLGGACSTSSLQEQVLEGLEPHGKIGELHIRRYPGTTSPSWLEKSLLASLSHIYLINCRNWQVLPSLSQLPDLKVLHIKEMHSVDRIDHRLYGIGGVFLSLKKLVLDDMPNLVEWTAESTDEVFPRLQELYMLNCPKLEKVPRVPSTVKKMRIEKHNSCYLDLSFSSKSNSFTLDIRGDAVQLLHQDFLHQHHIAAITALSINKYTGTGEVNIHLLASVRSLSLSRCVVADHRQLGTSLRKLQSLERLQISDCPGFDAFPDDAMLSSLRSLELKGCHPKLMDKLSDRTGPTWAKICSIPRLQID